MLPKVDVLFYRYDDVLLFHPLLPQLEKELTIREKKIVKERGKNPVQFSYRKLFTLVKRDGKDVASTYQGFLYKLISVCLKNNVTFFIRDLRKACIPAGFPAPRLDLMHGFRFSQQKLLEDALKKDQSGLIGAPTRYGKTTLMVNTLRAYPDLPTVVTAPGVDLCNQLYEDITGSRGITGREVKLICSGSRTRYPSETGITVCSADSLEKCDFGGTKLLLADEPHALVTNARTELINAFTCARRIGFGATLKGRFDGRDSVIEGLFGPVLEERTYLEAVEEGAICPLDVIFININISPGNYFNRDDAYKRLLFQNKAMANLTAQICHDIIPEDYQTMLFIKNEKQADLYMESIGNDATIAMAKRMSKQERKEITELMRGNVIKRCLCTDIYVQGVTFSDVRVLINCEAGGNNTTAIQKPGRLAEIRPGKKCGVVFDFMFHCLHDYPGNEVCLANDSAARRCAYEEKGYTIHDAYSIEQAKQIFDSII